MVQTIAGRTGYEQDEISRIAHLLRRAGFGATYEELEESLSRRLRGNGGTAAAPRRRSRSGMTPSSAATT